MSDARRVPAVEDFTVIRRELRRNRVIEACVGASILAGQRIPDEVFWAAGFSKEETAALSQTTKTWPINDQDLR